MTKPTVGFIGLGIMGLPMSKNLLGAGFPLVVHNRSRGSVEEMASLGAETGESAADVAARCDVLITVLPDSPDVEAVALGPDGAIAHMRPGSLYVDMSTVSPITATAAFEAGRGRGVDVLDAPVSGGELGARKGTLSIMVGGTRAAFERGGEVFAPLGRAVLCGENGAGQVVKACNQLLVAIQILGVSEALTLGAKAGVDPAKIVEVLGGGYARCGVLEMRGTRMVEGDFEPGFRGELHYKDVRIAVATGQEYGVPLPLAAAAHEMLKEMVVSGRGGLDHTALLALVEERAGMRRG